MKYATGFTEDQGNSARVKKNFSPPLAPTLLFTLIISLLFGTIGFSQSSFEDPAERILTKLSSVEDRIRQIEKNQQDILAKQEKILAELDRIRIWVRRN